MDLISRQAAIDAIEKHIDTFDAIDTNYLDGLRTAMNLLHELPSAQPEQCEDAVSRKAAVAKVNEYASIWMEYTEGMSKNEIAQAALDSAKQTMNRILSELPPVTPKQRTGKWIDTGGNEEWYAREYKCSECGGTMLGETNFCPNCGAKMEE